MIKKAFISFFIIFITYNLALIYVVNPHKFVSEHQWQDNQIKAQEYLHSKTNLVNNIVVGSSLSDRLVIGYLSDTYNLSMGGLGIFEGLETIIKKDIYPEKVYIEMNKLDRKASIDFTTSLNNPVMNFLRKHFISIRDGKQPMGMIAIPYGEKVTAYGLYITQTALHTIAEKIIKREDDSVKTDLVSKILPRLIEEESHISSSLDLEKDANSLKKHVDILEKNNVKVIFFEMPIQHQLCGLTKPTAIRNQFYKTFPRDKYQYIDMPNCKDYVTTDGLHLDQSSSLKYTMYFKDAIDNLK